MPYIIKHLLRCDSSYVCKNAILHNDQRLAPYSYGKLNGITHSIVMYDRVSPGTLKLPLHLRKIHNVNIEEVVELEPDTTPVVYAANITCTISTLSGKQYTIASLEDVKEGIFAQFPGCFFNANREYCLEYDGIVLCIVFERNYYFPVNIRPNIKINLKNISVVEMTHTLVNKINFKELGIGGLDNEAETIFRKTFSTRLLSNSTVEKIGIKHTKGILLYGPPGTGKTLIARKLASILDKDVSVKIINGPELVDKFVGETERKIRELFDPAIKNPNRIHVLIFDEIDSLFKTRGSTTHGDNVVNQILTMLDGVDSPRNILVIGMTNRKDRLDEAVLRSGRLEVHIEIGLPDYTARCDIIDIHTANLLKEGILKTDNYETLRNDLAGATENYSGSDLESMVKNALTFAIQRAMGDDNKLNEENLFLERGDFVELTPKTDEVLGEGDPAIEGKIKEGMVVMVTGKRRSGKFNKVRYYFPNAKVITNRQFIEMNDTEKAASLVRIFFSAEKLKNSVIIIKNIEDILGVSPSPCLINTFNTLFREKEPNLTVIITSETSRIQVNKSLIDLELEQN